MGIILIGGWESGSATAEVLSNGGALTTSIKRTGQYSCQFNLGNNDQKICEIARPGSNGTLARFSVATVYFRTYFYIGTNISSGSIHLIRFENTSFVDKCYVRINSSGNLLFYDKDDSLVQTGSSTLTTGTWYRIECKVGTGTSGAYEVLLNGNSELSGTANLTTANTQSVRIGGAVKSGTNSPSACNYYYDDHAISDSAYPGAGAVEIMQPNADGSTAQWTSGTNSSNYAEVDEIPTDDDTTYIKNTASAGQVHLVGLESASSAGISGTINAVQGWARVREDTSGTSAARLRIRSNATNSDTNTFNGSTSYTNIYKVLVTDPDTSSAWTTGALDALEVGVKEDNAFADRCTTLAVFVDFTAATGNSSSIPAASLTSSGQTPSGTTTEKHLASVPAASLTVTARTPSATTTENHFASLPLGTLTLSAQTPSGETSENDDNSSAIPLSSLTLTKNAGTAVVTEKHVAAVALATITLTKETPTATTTEDHYGAIPAASLTVTTGAPSASTTEHQHGAVPAASLTLTGRTPSAGTTEKHVSSLPLGTASVTPRTPSAATTEKHIASIPSRALTVTGNAIAASTTDIAGDPNTATLPLLTLTLTSYEPVGTLVTFPARTAERAPKDDHLQTILPLEALRANRSAVQTVEPLKRQRA